MRFQIPPGSRRETAVRDFTLRRGAAWLSVRSLQVPDGTLLFRSQPVSSDANAVMQDTSASAPKAATPHLIWHPVSSSSSGGELFRLGDVYRAKVPGGWFVLVTNNARGLMFYPDPEHTWDGASLNP